MTPKQYALKALKNSRGDDLERARHAFAQYTPEEMREVHGQSGIPRAELLRRYEEERALYEAAVAWMEGAP